MRRGLAADAHANVKREVSGRPPALMLSHCLALPLDYVAAPAEPSHETRERYPLSSD